MSVQVAKDFGLIIKKRSLQTRSISKKQILAILESDRPLDEDDMLLSFGPHFGEAVNEFIKRLESLGLQYGDDFIDFSDVTLPDWCNVFISLNNASN